MDKYLIKLTKTKPPSPKKQRMEFIIDNKSNSETISASTSDQHTASNAKKLSISHMYTEEQTALLSENENLESFEETDHPGEKQKTNKKQKAVQHFRSIWLQNYSWIEEKNAKPFCKLCQKTLTNNNVHIVRHQNSNYHKAKVNALKNQPVISDAAEQQAFKKKIDSIKIAELKIIMFVLQYNLAFTLVAPLIELIKSCATDSLLVKNLKCGKTKATETVNTVLKTEGLEQICRVLKQNKFSLIIDETTDITTSKCLALLVRYFDNTVGRVKDRFLTLIELSKSDAKSIYDSIISFFEYTEIPIGNLIGFAADNASVMMGPKNGVQKLLKNNNPFLYVLGCVCHSLHLCSSAASRKIPQHLEHMTRNFYTFFSHSSKRQIEFQEFQAMFNCKTHKILKTVSTRWLSLENVVNRILEQWLPLQHYFIGYQLENNDLAHEIYAQMTDVNKIYLTFLSYILNQTNKINIEFQSESPRIHLLLPTVKMHLRTILSNFVKQKFLSQSLKNINFQDEETFLDIESIYLGAKAEIIMKSLVVSNDKLSEIKIHCRNYYVELCTQILSRIDLEDSTLLALTEIHPKNLCRTITKLASIFPNLTNDNEIEELDSEWRMLLNQSLISTTDVQLEDFWREVFILKNGLNQKMFPKLEKFMGSILSLPHSSAAAERVFSQLNLIKDKKRNSLHTATINSVMTAKEMLQKCDAVNWNPSEDLLMRYQHRL